jgi:parallel beta-helix repeat protein
MEIWNHTLGIAERLFRHTWHMVMFLLVMTCLDSPSHASGRRDDAQISIVDNRAGYLSRTNYADMAAAVNAATEHTTIHLNEGVHVIDNPVVLARPGVRIQGRGRETTIVRPRNAGKPMFEFKADNVGVENLSMDAELENGRARANFGVYIKEGYAHSKVLNTQISNTGASAIIGFEISDSKVVGNIILNSGDDGIQKRGHRLTISNNIIVDYFDEAIDVLGSDVVVTNNYVNSGRIGIVVGRATNPVVACNTAEDHFHGGIFVASNGRGTVSHNTVKDSVESAYALNSLEVIDSNRAKGNHRVGFEIRNVREGEIVRNAVVGARIGFDLVQSSGNIMYNVWQSVLGRRRSCQVRSR